MSAEGAALCYRTICVDGAVLFGRYGDPQVTMHTYDLLDTRGQRTKVRKRALE